MKEKFLNISNFLQLASYFNMLVLDVLAIAVTGNSNLTGGFKTHVTLDLMLPVHWFG